MTEQALKDYFENKLTASQLALDLNTPGKENDIDKIKEKGHFEVTKAHLIKLCDDVLNEQLLPTDLGTIAFTIICSDYFVFNEQVEEDVEILEEVIYDWDNPEVGFELSLKNVVLWKEYLQTGDYKFDDRELKW